MTVGGRFTTNFLYPGTLSLPEDRRVRVLDVDSNRRILNQWQLHKLQDVVPNPGFLESLIKDFEEDSVQTLQQLRLAVSERDTEGYRHVLHTLIGVARDLGATVVEYTCQNAKDASFQDLDRKVIDIEQAIQCAFEALAAYLATRRRST